MTSVSASEIVPEASTAVPMPRSNESYHSYLMRVSHSAGMLVEALALLGKGHDAAPFRTLQDCRRGRQATSADSRVLQICFDDLAVDGDSFEMRWREACRVLLEPEIPPHDTLSRPDEAVSRAFRDVGPDTRKPEIHKKAAFSCLFDTCPAYIFDNSPLHVCFLLHFLLLLLF